MAKVAVLVPYLDMCEIARPLVTQYENITPICVEYTQTGQVAQRVRELQDSGCDLIVARGLQAQIIRHTVKLPLVEMRVTTQELGCIMLELKRELHMPCPRMALIGYANMFGDLSRFNELFDIDLRCYMVHGDGAADLSAMVEQALQDGCQAVFGGDVVCQKAHSLKVPCRFIPSGEESIQTALEMANTVCYAIDLEKRNTAEMTTMLNYTFSGIMQIDTSGVILRANQSCCHILDTPLSAMIGQPVERAIPNLDRKALDAALLQGEETYAMVIKTQQRSVVLNLAPIQVDGAVRGVVITMQEGQRVTEMDSRLRRELYQRGFVAKYTFENIPTVDRTQSRVVQLASKMAKYSASVLITGEHGTGKDILAQCIHNESLYKNNAFVPLDCSAWMPETLDNMLFGNYTTRKDSEACLVELARDGTLYLAQVQHLPLETQYKVAQLIRGKFMHNGSNQPVAMKVRVIASTHINLAAKLEKGEFRKDLYYALSVLNLELQPLRRNKENVLRWFNYYLDEWQKQYKRYVHLTNTASSFLQEYDWPGNLDQLNNVCERIVLLAEHRNIDERFLREQLEQSMPAFLPGTEKVVLYKDKKAIEIAELLRKYHGNREKVAAELGVSKTTLWRYIKKYGISPDFSY